MTRRLFSLGQVVMTAGVAGSYDGRDLAPYLMRHVTGDWGKVDKDDWKENDFSVKNGYRVLSAYDIEPSVTIWIITEADRSSTTILFPDEY